MLNQMDYLIILSLIVQILQLWIDFKRSRKA